jgi:hypothetical protein
VTTDKLIRWAGLATILGSALLVLFPVLHPNHDPDGFRSPLWIPAHLTPHLAAITYLFALPAICARQGERNGWLGLAGYVLATIGTAQLLMVAWIELFIIPFLSLQLPGLEDTPPPGVEVAAMLMQASLAVGYLVLGLGIIRAGVLPRGAGVLLAIAAPIFGIGDMALRLIVPQTTLDLFVPSTVLFALAMGWVGLGLWAGPDQHRAGRPTEAPADGTELAGRFSAAAR